MLRPIVLERLGIQIDSAVFVPVEAAHSFNKYIWAIERMRIALHREDEVAFYLSLLATEIKQRHSVVFGIGNQLLGKERAAFISVFSKANSILKESPQ